MAAIHEAELAKVEAAYEAGDYDTANVTVGESIGLVRDIPRQANWCGDALEAAIDQSLDPLTNWLNDPYCV